MLIFIIGYMGSGKTTIGKRIAGEIGYRFFDLDEMLIAETQYTIADFFDRYGEEAFRMREREILLNLIGNYHKDTVIATGGGTPCFSNNMDVMNAKGLTVFLDAPLETVLERLIVEKLQRPILKNVEDDKLADFIRKHIESRIGYYNKAKIQIKTDGLTQEQILKMLIDSI